jgi:hypothetical protein
VYGLVIHLEDKLSLLPKIPSGEFLEKLANSSSGLTPQDFEQVLSALFLEAEKILPGRRLGTAATEGS